MTYKQFLGALKKAAKLGKPVSFFASAPLIRIVEMAGARPNPQGARCCPIEAVAVSVLGGTVGYSCDARRLKLPAVVMSRIVDAADNYAVDKTTRAVRRDLLKALGLKETKV